MGHTIQNNGGTFDNSASFRFIYSFHMPLFVFLSGCAASYWITRLKESESNLKSLTIRLVRSSKQLLLPFLAWTILAFFVFDQKETLSEYLIKVFKQPDYSLWFLPCIFWCILYTCIFYALIHIIENLLNKISLIRLSGLLSNPLLQFFLLILSWSYLRTKLPSEYGLVFANWFSGGLFFYFALGLFSFAMLSSLKSRWIRVIPYRCFFLLVPYWSKGAPNDLIGSAPMIIKNTGFIHYYSYIVAISGTLVFFDLAKIVFQLQSKYINRVLCLLGEASLGIYAVHTYFISIQPQVITPIFISFLCFEAILLIPILRTVLLGR